MSLKFLVIAIVLSSISINNEGDKRVLPAHAHNDYEHKRPLFDALDHHFKSIEADVFSIGDSLFVAHDFDDITPGRTLRELYLNPLKKRIKKNGGSVYGNSEEVILLVDIKDDGLKTYQLLHKILEDYKKMLTSYASEGVKQGAVSIVVSGNRPMEYMENQKIRYAGFDGRISNLDRGISADLMPVVSDNWNKHFSWRGKGEMPVDEREKLHQIIEKGHENGYMIRFWSTPEKPKRDREMVWNELVNAGVDLVGTDDLSALKEFLRR